MAPEHPGSSNSPMMTDSPTVKPVPVKNLTLDEKVETLTMCLAQLTDYVTKQMPSTNQATSSEKDKANDIADAQKNRLPKFALPQPFDGTMQDTKSFISSVLLYIKGREPEFCTTKSKIMFTLSYMQGGKAQFWKNQAINEMAKGKNPFQSFSDFMGRLEAQFGDPNPKATAVGKLKTM